ncbi:cysteine hydrolase family protein [Desulfoplanes formicivorans]|uniref:Nicotinamidase n=1 Tax=Desulfoplanes formicivorans TaxID=1592317 RepID=A0A194AIJ4_9BACT|nr:isochorismatase family cysteine hydrolase [Desulfoplanes formicivorans]GAU09907.1 nicotinamidase [Desulfoplanes formicivorans]
MQQALLIVDMLNDFVLPHGSLAVPGARHIIPGIRQYLELFRQKAWPVFFVCDEHEPDDPEFIRMGWPPHALRGTPGSQVVDELAPLPGEHLVAKQHYSAFYKTDLEETLQRLGVQEVIVTGVVSNICVLYTAADAVMRGYGVRVPASCVAALTPEEGAFALRQMEQVLGVTVEKE